MSQYPDPSISPAAEAKTLKVLIIDDMQSVRDALSAYLCPMSSAIDSLNALLQTEVPVKYNFWINEAEQGEEGIAMALAAFSSRKPYDVIFVDMLMPPGISGLEVIRGIRQFDSKVPIIVCTAISNETPPALAAVNGGKLPTILAKPVTSAHNLPELVCGLIAAS